MTEHCNSHMYGQQNEGSCSCGCGSHNHLHDPEEKCHCAEKFLEIADEAWAEVLKEKIKSKILTHKGEHMDKLAEMIAIANGEKWKNIIASKMKCHEFKENLKDFFSSCD